MSAAPPSMVRVGFDEAGLGPTLGPLVVAGFATRADDGAAGEPSLALLERLAQAVGPPGTRDGRIEVGDSKKIHAGARKLARIERSALATVAWVYGALPGTVAQLLDLVHDGDAEHDDDRRAPWWAALDEALPVACERGEIEEAGARLAAVATRAGVEALWYRADVVSAARVNRELAAEVAREGTKNTWATHAVLRHAGRALAALDAPALSVWCDKAGGRQAYRAPLERVFPDLCAESGLPLFERGASLTTRIERRERSRYGLALGQRAVELGFVMKGDQLDARIAWASILAKYLRELIMRALNAHFAARVPGLRATAGYPQDARRFIAAAEAALGPETLDRGIWIRTK